ncbi:MAG TPA: N-acetyl-gamma-glutamyl-phosphate reductase [Syntrophobacteraceae bacterium]|nr:N-acetyl-gamma-glutamyl-phosphate reductase [Syntrophobacteraceae bacterium]
MLRVAIAGASGYTGLELLRILCAHPSAMVCLITSRQQKGQRIDDFYPAFKRRCDLVFEDTDPERLASSSDLVFTALPHLASMDVIADLLQRGARVVDLSADYRLKDPEVFRQWYSPHKTPQLLNEAVYGLPELYREKIRSARLVANPGCYPTSVILAVAPVLSRALIDPETIIADSKSGVSGAGRGMELGLHFCEVNEGFRAYKVAEHRHTPEIEQELSVLAARPVKVNFTPHLVPMSRGILSTVYCSLKPGVGAKEVDEAFESWYADELFVRLGGPGRLPATLQVRGSNYCDLGWRVDERTRRLIVISVIDNLTRGASGQAVCNMNIMNGLPENAGLQDLPWQP